MKTWVLLVAVSTLLIGCGSNKAVNFESKSGQSGVSILNDGDAKLCPDAGHIQVPAGHTVHCVPGDTVSISADSYSAPNDLYSYPAYPLDGQSQLGCDQYTTPGDAYVPIYINGQLSCVQLAPLTQAAQSLGDTENPYLKFGYDYYYAFPPYTGDGCSTVVDLGQSTSYKVCL